MVGAGVGGIVAVVSSDDQQVILVHQAQQLAQLLVEHLDLLCVALDITAMAPQSVEVDQVDVAQALEVALCDLDGLLHAMDGALGLVGLGQAFAVEDVEDLTNGNNLVACVLDSVQSSSAVGLQSIVVAVCGTLELALLLANVGTGDDTADHPLRLQGDLTSDLTAAVQLVQTEGLLVAADLQNGVSGGVDDHVAGSDLFFCQLVQDLSAGSALVANDNAAGTGGQLIEQLLGEAGLGEGLEGHGDVQAHLLPVTGHGVLAGGSLVQVGVVTQRILNGIDLCHGVQVCHTQLLQVGDVETLVSAGSVLGDVAQGIGTDVTVALCIGQCADTQRVHNDGENTLKLAHIKRSLSGKGLPFPCF